MRCSGSASAATTAWPRTARPRRATASPCRRRTRASCASRWTRCRCCPAASTSTSGSPTPRTATTTTSRRDSRSASSPAPAARWAWPASRTAGSASDGRGAPAPRAAGGGLRPARRPGPSGGARGPPPVPRLRDLRARDGPDRARRAPCLARDAAGHRARPCRVRAARVSPLRAAGGGRALEAARALRGDLSGARRVREREAAHGVGDRPRPRRWRAPGARAGGPYRQWAAGPPAAAVLARGHLGPPPQRIAAPRALADPPLPRVPRDARVRRGRVALHVVRARVSDRRGHPDAHTRGRDRAGRGGRARLRGRRCLRLRRRGEPRVARDRPLEARPRRVAPATARAAREHRCRLRRLGRASRRVQRRGHRGHRRRRRVTQARAPRPRSRDRAAPGPLPRVLGRGAAVRRRRLRSRLLQRGARAPRASGARARGDRARRARRPRDPHGPERAGDRQARGGPRPDVRLRRLHPARRPVPRPPPHPPRVPLGPPGPGRALPDAPRGDPPEVAAALGRARPAAQPLDPRGRYAPAVNDGPVDLAALQAEIRERVQRKRANGAYSDDVRAALELPLPGGRALFSEELGDPLPALQDTLAEEVAYDARSHRRFVGGAITFGRRVAIGLVRWWIAAITDRQERINQLLARAVIDLRDAPSPQFDERLSRLEREWRRRNDDQGAASLESRFFAARFSGDERVIRRQSEAFVDLFRGRTRVPDLGSARGPFLRLLRA